MAILNFRRRETLENKTVKKVTARNNVLSLFLSAAKYLFLVMIMPPMLNYGGLKQERAYLNSQSVLYDIGFGQKLQLDCRGQGQPTVILDAPTGQTSATWLAVQQELSQLTKTCVYDRAGLGLSEPPPRLNLSDPGEGAVARTLGPPSTLVRMVSDLHRLVTFAAPQERPLLLVGTELGGLVARAFAHLHPQDVAGLVLVDPLSESLFDDIHSEKNGPGDNLWIEYWFGHVVPSCRLLQFAAMAGLTRIGLLTGLMTPPHMSDDLDVVASLKHQLCDPFHLQAVIDEHLAVNMSFQQMTEIRDAWPLPSGIVSTVVTGSQGDHLLAPALNSGWDRAVQDVIRRLPGCRHVVIAESDRQLIHKFPGKVSGAITDIIKTWRSQK